VQSDASLDFVSYLQTHKLFKAFHFITLKFSFAQNSTRNVPEIKMINTYVNSEVPRSFPELYVVYTCLIVKYYEQVYYLPKSSIRITYSQNN
jgi:hypothetical protein